MSPETLSALRNCELNASTAPLSNLRVGGSASALVTVRAIEHLQETLRIARDTGSEWMVIGGGTNVVFPPRYDGILIQIRAQRLSIHGTEVSCEADVRWMPLLRAAMERGLGGMEAFAGLPGTVGGAVRGNAGCFGLTVRDVLVHATLVDGAGGIQVQPVEWFDYGYRMSRLKVEPGWIVWDATLRFQPVAREAIDQKMRSVAALRSSKQPAGKSTGSFFVNPGELNAGALIDQAGLKGTRVGGAYVSEKHGNFLMSDGTASPEDLAGLVSLVQHRVEEQYRIFLTPEVVLVNQPWWEEHGVRFHA